MITKKYNIDTSYCIAPSPRQIGIDFFKKQHFTSIGHIEIPCNSFNGSANSEVTDVWMSKAFSISRFKDVTVNTLFNLINLNT